MVRIHTGFTISEHYTRRLLKFTLPCADKRVTPSSWMWGIPWEMGSREMQKSRGAHPRESPLFLTTSREEEVYGKSRFFTNPGSDLPACYTSSKLKWPR
jgi:hypothetical protein